jgi:hypothetical protein
MRRITAATLAFAMSFAAAPLFAAAAGGPRAPRAGQAQALGSIAGTSTTSTGQVVANAAVQLRNLANGQLVGTTTSAANGGFTFAGVQAGQFAVEVVNAAGQIIGTSASISLVAGGTITGITVTASAALAGAAAGGGAAAAGAAAGAGGAAVGASTAVIITGIAAAAGVVGAVAAATSNASPSR